MGRQKILIVDDEENIRFTFERFLTAEGYAVATASNYEEAIAAFAETSFDLVFADILLGNQTGVDLLRDLKERGQLCPVVLITGSPEVETAAQAVRLGAYDYIPKPVTRQILQRVARMALNLRNVELEKEKYRLNLEAIFNSVRAGIVTVDGDLRIVEFNPAAGRLTGLARQDVGRSLEEPAFDCNRSWLSALREALGSRVPAEINRFHHLIRGQKGGTFSLDVHPLVDPHDRQLGAVTVIRDETRLDSLERDLNDRHQLQRLTGRSRRMQEVYHLIDALADVDTTVLITGESGTGKELAAEAIHYGGNRRSKPLVKVNCSALMESLLESELFGHVRGAFTGAVQDKVGRFQKADGGTIFLDEIGEITPSLQTKLLRVLQEKEFERVGESTPIRVDVRIIAATNRDLAAKVRRGEFREDLFYRLKVVNVHLPPLRDRVEDIPLLTEVFVGRFRERFRKEIAEVAPEVLQRFLEYPWPGNVRELEHAIEHAFILCAGGEIGLCHLASELRDSLSAGRPAGGSEAAELEEAIARAGGNKAKAARFLGISRKTLYRRMERLGMAVDDRDGVT